LWKKRSWEDEEENLWNNGISHARKKTKFWPINLLEEIYSPATLSFLFSFVIINMDFVKLKWGQI